MKKVLFLFVALSLSCCSLKQKTDKWQTVCEMSAEYATKSTYFVSNTGEEDFVQCRIQSLSYNKWKNLDEWPECEDLDGGESVLKSVESKHTRLRLQIGTHHDIHGWCTIIQDKGGK